MGDIFTIPAFDYDDVTGRDAASFLAECRRSMPMIRLTSDQAEKNLVLVASPRAVQQVFADAESFSSTDHPQSRRFDSDVTPQTACIYAQAGFNLKNIAVWSDGAYHSRVRKLIQGAFSAPQVNAKSPYIQTVIDQIIGEFPDLSNVEFVSQYANRLPTLVVTREFGFDPSFYSLMREVTDTVSVMSDTLSPVESTAIAAHPIIRLQTHLLHKIKNLESMPENCLLRQLAEARIEDEPALSQSELLWLATLLLAAGGHTTAGLIAWNAYMLASRPDVQERIRRQPDLAESFAEETIRLHGPVPSNFRRVVRDVTLEGVDLPAGTILNIRTDSLNFDEEKWPNATEFDIDRPNVRRHATFGSNDHFCIGNLLARREMVLTVRALTARFSSIEFAAEAETLKSFDAHMLTRLPLKFRI